ncbi:MAG TPA: TadE family protein [Candidatus Polarisedimenticolia bacterium]|nr:TadE family protein [Candidatus Polarisedimenticolia bacterium]
MIRRRTLAALEALGRGERRGQALSEFALIAPIFFLVILGILQMGLLFAGQNGLTNAAREAARYASTLPTPNQSVAGNCISSGTNAEVAYTRLTAFSMRQYVPAFIAANIVQGTPSGLANCGAWALSLPPTGAGIAYCKRDNTPSDTTDDSWSVRVRVVMVYRHPMFIPLVGRIFSSTNTWQLGATEEMRVEGPNRTSAQVGGFSTCP